MKNTEITKENITEAFWQLYCEKPIEKIHVSEIMQKAGYNRGTFYAYFNNVHDILESIEDEIIETVVDAENAIKNIQTTSNSFEEIFSVYVSVYEKKRKYMSVLLSFGGDIAFQKKVKDIVYDFVYKDLESKIPNEMKRKYFTEFIICGTMATAIKWFNESTDSDQIELFKLVHAIANSNLPENNCS